MKTFILAILLFLPLPLCAQQLQGRVSDAENGTPIETATLAVWRDGKAVDFTVSDRQGRYRLPWAYTDTMEVRVSFLGYQPVTVQMSQAGIHDFRLRPATISLREVEIKSDRIYTRKDTLRFDLSRFATERDQYLRDVLQRLPGIEVSENGTISYQGKPIDHFLVEGMDLSGGRYNQLNNTLSAKAVKTAEIMENYQSIKALKGKLPTHQVALNLKLDPQMRDHWMGGATLGGGWKSTEEEHSESPLFTTALHAWQLGRARQTLYNYKGNNTGHSLMDEQRMLTGQEWTVPTGHLLAQVGFSSPLALPRTLLNNTHTLNLNRLHKYPGDRLLRLQAGYTHHEQRQQRTSTTLYYQPDDTLSIHEVHRQRLCNDELFLETFYEENNDHHLLRQHLRLDGEQARGSLDQPQQSLNTHRLTVAGQTEWLRQRDAHTWQVNALLQASYLPATLRVAEAEERHRQYHLLVQTESSYLHKAGLWSQSIALRLLGEQRLFQQPADEDLRQWSARVTPQLQRERGAWLARLTLPLTLLRLTPRQESYWLCNANLFLRYYPNQHWQGWLFGHIERSVADLLSLYSQPYRKDYRTWYAFSTLTPLVQQRNIELYAEYKDAVQELFATLRLNYLHRHGNTLYEQTIQPDTTCYTPRHQAHQGERYTLSSTLSKGFYDWHVKASIELSLTRQTGAFLAGTKGEPSTLQHYRNDWLMLRPHLIWTPLPQLELSYRSDLGYGGTQLSSGQRLSPLLQFRQAFSLSLDLGPWQLQLHGDHYINEVEHGHYLTTHLADATLSYRHRKWRLDLSASNLFNQKVYAYTSYSATHSYSTRLGIRPREFWVKWDFPLPMP